MRRLLVVCFALLLVGAGTVGAFSTIGLSPVAATPSDAGVAGPTASVQQSDFDPDEPIGCVGGVCYDDELGIDQSDGLSDEEFEQFTKQAMARVEYIRGQKFQEDVPVDVMTRAEYREQSQGGGDGGSEFNRWNDQVWKGLMIVGEDSGSDDEIGETLGSAVGGFYSPSQNQIVIITPDTENPIISDTTLVHEYVHAMQDQYHDLGDARYRGETQDRDLAINGIVEGEAVYTERLYEEYCESEWECASPPEQEGGGGGGDLNLGIYLTVFQPYSDGPGYVHDIVEADGWDAVGERMEDPPRSTTQVIHRTDREPTPIDFTDEATDGWELYPDQGVDGADTVGEASIYAMLYYQSREYGAEAIDWRQIGAVSHPYEQLNYVSEPSDGWANDKLYPYRRGDDEDGYVWVTEWESEDDAIEFYEAYQAILTAHNVSEQENGMQMIADGPFRGTYGVHVDETTVTIAHGTDEAAVEQLRPSIVEALGDSGSSTDENATTETNDTGQTESPIPGFGVVVAALSLLAVAAIARWRQ